MQLTVFYYKHMLYVYFLILYSPPTCEQIETDRIGATGCGGQQRGAFRGLIYPRWRVLMAFAQSPQRLRLSPRTSSQRVVVHPILIVLFGKAFRKWRPVNG